MGLWGNITGAANWLGRKVGAGAQYLGNKLADGAQYIGNKVSNIPIVGGAIKNALDTVSSVGQNVANAGQSLIGGRGGIGGAVDSLKDAVGSVENLAKPISFH